MCPFVENSFVIHACVEIFKIDTIVSVRICVTLYIGINKLCKILMRKYYASKYT